MPVSRPTLKQPIHFLIGSPPIQIISSGPDLSSPPRATLEPEIKIWCYTHCMDEWTEWSECSTRWAGFLSFRLHDDVIKWKHFLRYWPFVRGIHRWPVDSLHKGQWRGALMFSLTCTWIKGWVNNCEAGDLRRHCVHYDVIVMHVADRSKLLSLIYFNDR